MFDNVYFGKRVLITGNTGFKGAWLTLWLLQLGARVIGLADRVPTQPSLFESALLGPRIAHHVCDVRDPDKVVDIVQRAMPDFVFHLAAQAIVSRSYRDPLETLSTNVLGTAAVLDAVRRLNHPCSVILITSDKCYENIESLWGYKETDRLGGHDIYSASKAAAELVAHAYRASFLNRPDTMIRVATARAGNVIGGGDWAADRIVVDCMKSWAKSRPVRIRNPNSTRPWQHVLEPLSGYLWLGAKLAQEPLLNGESFNFGPATDRSVTVLELLRLLASHWNFPADWEPFSLDNTADFSEARLLKLNCEKALANLGWRATLDEETCAELTSKWYLNYYRGNLDPDAESLAQLARYTSIAKSKGLPWSL